MPFIAPQLDLDAFHCPHCSVFAKQNWTCVLFNLGKTERTDLNSYRLPGFKFSRCDHCNEQAMWREDAMIHPEGSSVEPPSLDLPEDVRHDYVEASVIANRSPRGAAALLRLALQKLCKELGEKGDNINDDIASLVQKGLPPGVQEALDVVRVVGNESVHPGQINLNDDRETAVALFSVLNLIVTKMITDPRELREIYERMPEGKRKGIEARDSKPNHSAT